MDDDDIQSLVDQAMAEAMAEVNGETDGGDDAAADQPQAVETPDLASQEPEKPAGQSIELLGDVDLNVKIELGRTHMLVEDVLRLGSGSVVELDKLAGDPVDVYVNDRMVARGEVLVLNDNFCIRISEIVANLDEQDQAEMVAEAVAEEP